MRCCRATSLRKFNSFHLKYATIWRNQTKKLFQSDNTQKWKQTATKAKLEICVLSVFELNGRRQYWDALSNKTSWWKQSQWWYTKCFFLFDFKKQMKPPASFSHCSHYATREYCQLMLMLSSSEMYVASGCFLILKHVVLFWGEMFFGQVLIERHYKSICRLTYENNPSRKNSQTHKSVFSQ